MSEHFSPFRPDSNDTFEAYLMRTDFSQVLRRMPGILAKSSRELGYCLSIELGFPEDIEPSGNKAFKWWKLSIE